MDEAAVTQHRTFALQPNEDAGGVALEGYDPVWTRMGWQRLQRGDRRVNRCDAVDCLPRARGPRRSTTCDEASGKNDDPTEQLAACGLHLWPTSPGPSVRLAVTPVPRHEQRRTWSLRVLLREREDVAIRIANAELTRAVLLPSQRLEYLGSPCHPPTKIRYAVDSDVKGPRQRR